MIKVVKIAKYPSAREAIQTSSTNHSNLCVFEFCFQGLFKTALHFQVLFKPVQTLSDGYFPSCAYFSKKQRKCGGYSLEVPHLGPSKE